MALALDEQKDNDQVFDEKGYVFLVDKNLLQSAAPITVDIVNGMFTVLSNIQLSGGGSCGSCSSC